MKRAVLTLAMGKPLYVEMAYNLARSFLWWHRDGSLPFVLATDSDLPTPPDLATAIRVIRLDKDQYGRGFSSKLHLDRISPADETLFLDADCLCAANLEPVFARFHGHEVSVVGHRAAEGEWFGDIAARCRMVGVPSTPRFCGGLYYFKKGPVCEQVFGAARELEKRYDELGLVRLRGLPNEEPLIGLGMALHGQLPVPEDGSIKAEPMYFSGDTEIDVFAGRARLRDRPDQPKLRADWQIPPEARPAVVHFNCSFAERPPYTAEVVRLRQVMRHRWPLVLATVYAALTQTLPYRIVDKFKGALRPIFHACFGPRMVKKSQRI